GVRRHAVGAPVPRRLAEASRGARPRADRARAQIRPGRAGARVRAVNGPPQPQDLVITMLGTYVRPTGDTVWSGGLVTLLGQFGFSHGAARVALMRLVRRELLARIRDGRHVHYRLTSRCERLLEEGDGRIFSLGD